MTAKLIVLYPQPTDVGIFETAYHGEHMPLMRRLVGPEVPMATYRVESPSGSEPPYYRVAEIDFPHRDAFLAFLSADGAREGQQSSIKVSTGGTPTFLLCISD